MSTPTKQDVISYLKHDRSLTSGKNLYNRFPTKSLAIQQSFSRLPTNNHSIKRVCYELCKLVGIKENQLNAFLNSQVISNSIALPKTKRSQEPSREQLLLGLDPTSDQFKTAIISLLPAVKSIEVPTFEKGLPGIAARKLFLKSHNWSHKARSAADLNKEIEALVSSAGSDRTDDINAILEERATLIQSKTVAMPVTAKQKIKLWEQFPFLREKECPNEYKILVNDLITAYHTYMDAQPGLHDALTDADRKEIADTVKENYKLNKLIWDELEYYHKNKAPLGEHPIFKEKEDADAIKALSGEELSKKIISLRANITRNTNKSQDQKKPIEKREQSASLVSRDQRLLDIAIAEIKTR